MHHCHGCSLRTNDKSEADQHSHQTGHSFYQGPDVKSVEPPKNKMANPNKLTKEEDAIQKKRILDVDKSEEIAHKMNEAE